MNMPDALQYLLQRLHERLWFKPVMACLLSVAGVMLAYGADQVTVDWRVPTIEQGAIVELLKIIAASMLGVATFAVASMVAAYASTDQSATARAFPLIVADDMSQNALSTFVGAFIFAIIALSATTNEYFGKAGRFTLFVLTVLTLIIVVLVFVRWVDSVARLGRLGAVVTKVEQATAEAMARRRTAPCLGGMVAEGPPQGQPFFSDRSGYLQHLDLASLQRLAVEKDAHITLAVLPGALVVPTRPIGYMQHAGDASPALVLPQLRKACTIGPVRHFDDDPRFGLTALSEISSRALSPGINDPGTAIGILASLHRLFADWVAPVEPDEPQYDRVSLPLLSLDDMFDDVFPAIARDGGGMIEVAMRIQLILGELGRCGDPHLALLARRHAALALGRAERMLDFPPDLELLRRRHAHYVHRPQSESPARPEERAIEAVY